MQFEHVHLQLQAAVNGLGIALVLLPLIQDELHDGPLTCPILKPEWSAQDYLLVSEHRRGRCRSESFWVVDHEERAISVAKTVAIRLTAPDVPHGTRL